MTAKLTKAKGSRKKLPGAAMTGAALRELRLGEEVSQVALAREAGYHEMYLSSMENGRVRINERAARLLVGALARLSERRKA